MPVDVEGEVVVRRPRSEVAAFLFDPRKDVIWGRAVLESRPLEEGPLRPGLRIGRVVRYFGRQYDYTYEVVDADGNRVRMRHEGRFPFEVQYEIQEAAEGTRVRVRASASPRGALGAVARVLKHTARVALERDLESLRSYLENDLGHNEDALPASDTRRLAMT